MCVPRHPEARLRGPSGHSTASVQRERATFLNALRRATAELDTSEDPRARSFSAGRRGSRSVTIMRGIRRLLGATCDFVGDWRPRTLIDDLSQWVTSRANRE